MDDGVAGIVQALIGVIIGGFLTLATTVWVEARRARNQAVQRRAEQAEEAAQEIATTLMELRDLTRQDMFRSSLSSRDLIKAEEELERRIELLSLRLTNVEARIRIHEVMDLSGYDVATSDYVRIESRKHLIECCGYLMRGEPLPPEPSAVRRLRADVEAYRQLQDEGREEREREERAKLKDE